ncbi:DM13 domain-containing protein [bacterium]|nr:DM13 domain-containing protein [bacterium]
MPTSILTRLFCAFLLSATLLGCGSDSMVDSSSNTEEKEVVNTSTLRMGPFLPAAAGKEAAGSATLRTLENGSLRLDFSTNFSLTNGPGLFVFLSNSEFLSDDAVNLGSFISPSGEQMYTIPEGVSLESFTHVTVHCVPYNVTFAYAELK